MAAAKGNKYALGNKGGAPPLYKTPGELQSKIDEYFNQDAVKITICGLALFLGFAERKSLLDYEKKEEFKKIISDAKVKIKPSSNKAKFKYVLQFDPSTRIRERRALDPMYRLKMNFASLIRFHIKNKNSKKTFDLVGYSLDELKLHLEKRFTKEMSWANYGSYWHIDHIIPASFFKCDNIHDPQFKKCWGLSNLQPLEAGENIRKSNKLCYGTA